MQEGLWPHLAALGWQALWVTIFVRGGAMLFRKRVMKSGPQGSGQKRGWIAALLGKSDRLKLSPFRPRIEGKGRRTMQASRRHIVMGLFAGAAGP
jgi:hypothetical protein